MLRKLIFLFFTINTYFSGEQNLVILSFFSMSFLLFTARCMPFRSNSLNRLETSSNLAVFITIFGGFLSLYELSEKAQIACFVTVLFINLRFVTSCSMTVCKLAIGKYRYTFSKAWLFAREYAGCFKKFPSFKKIQKKRKIFLWIFLYVRHFYVVFKMEWQTFFLWKFFFIK